MHIQSIRVREFGTIDQLEVDLTGGLNVISGPNEAGKSTLMKSVWFALTRRCTSKAQEIREVVPNSGGTPEVEVDVVVDGTTYELEKTFDGQGGTAHLRVDHQDGGIDDYAGEEADEVIREALGFGEASGRTGVPEHFGFWPAVWVNQEERQVDPGKHLTGEGDPESISSVLAQIGGDLMAGSGAEIVERAKEEYEKFYTSSGNRTTRSGAPLHEAMERRDRAEERFEELRQTRDRYEEDLDRHNRIQNEIESLSEQLPELKEKAEDAREAFDQVQELKETIEKKDTELGTAESERDRLEERLGRRTDLRNKIDELKENLEEKQAEIEEKSGALETHRDGRSELAESKEQAEKRLSELKETERRLRAHLDVLRAQERLGDLKDRTTQLEDLKERRDELTGEIAAIEVEEEDIERLETLKQTRDETRTRLETAAARLRFRASSEMDVQVGEEEFGLSGGEETARSIEEPTTIRVGSRLEIEVEPGGEDLASIREAAREAKEEYEEALEDLGVESLADARSQRQERGRLETELESVKDQIEGLLPEEDEDLGEAKIRAENDLKQAKEKRESYTDSEEETSLPTGESDVRERLDDLEDELEAAREDVEEARREVQVHDDRTQKLQGELQRAETQAESTQESLEATREDLEDHRETHGPDEELQDALSEAQAAFEEKKEEVEELRAELDALNPDGLKARKERTEEALEATREEKEELEGELNKVRGRLESDDLRGLHGRLEDARQEREEAEAEVGRLERQAEAAKLLYETLTEKRAEARKKYLAPLREEVEDLLGRFFEAENSTVEFGEAFDLQKLSRSSDGSVKFDQLSTGAKQQLSVLVRLAMARLIARERPHPMFLDDALSDTDANRFEAIADILHSAAREMQIILTTCHHRRHRQLGVSTKRIESLKAGASSVS